MGSGLIIEIILTAGGASSSDVFTISSTSSDHSDRGRDSRLTNKEFEMDSFCAWDGDTLVLNILGKPGSNRDAIGKVKSLQLKVSVTASPVAGRATDHMVRFLAREFGVNVSDITVVFGRFNVNKQLRIKSPKKLPAVVSKHLSQLPLID